MRIIGLILIVLGCVWIIAGLARLTLPDGGALGGLTVLLGVGAVLLGGRLRRI